MLKKVCVFFLIFTITVCANSAIYANYDPEPGFRIYTADGGIYTDSDDVRLSAAGGSGAKVYARYNQFNKVLKSENVLWDDSIGEFYSCYGNDSSNETLTLGFISGIDTDMSDIQKLKYQVSKQINYIISVGGVMTGYSFESAGSLPDRYALNISWDIGEEHHYARFESEPYSPACMGYYDLCYSESGIVQYDIPYMNEHFGVAYDVQ